MVLASPPPPRPPRLPVDPDDVNTLTWKVFNTLRALEQLRSQLNDTCILQIFKMQYLYK